jgi:hypothetical protein
MSKRRIIFFAVAVIIVIVFAAVFTSPLGRLLIHEIVIDELHPERISWDGKTAWKRCDSALAHRTAWPESPQAACAAMHLCANEAPLSDRQKQMLAQAIRAMPDCPPP